MLSRLLESSLSSPSHITGTLCIVLGTSLAYLVYRSMARPHRFPPGPAPLPFIGNIRMFSKPAFAVFKETAKEYGDIFSVKIVSHWVVILNNIDVVKEALLRKQDQFAGRPEFYSAELLTAGYKDIAFSPASETWKLHRKLGHTAIRTFATGKNLEKLVFTMTAKLEKALEDKGDEPIDPKNIMGIAVYNILSSLCFGQEYEYNDARVQKYIDLLQEQYDTLGNGMTADYIPFMKYVPTPHARKVKQMLERYYGPIREEVAEHRKTYDPDNIRDLIDSLFKAQQEAIDEGSQKEDSLTEAHLCQTVSDMFGAGTETTIMTFHWAFALLCEHPDIQAKVAEECDRVIGRDRLPSMGDRGQLPYTEATLYEILRYSSVAPLAIPHATMSDGKLCGYDIPKGTWVMVNIWGLHRDERYWEKPFDFYPEHFLDEEGKVRQHPNSFLPFSVGRRSCLGESFAKAEVFLLFSWIFQHFSFSKLPGAEASLCESAVDMPLIHQPKPFKVVCKKRF